MGATTGPSLRGFTLQERRKSRTATSRETGQVGTMPAQKQGVPERKAYGRKGGKVTDVTKKRTMVTRSMQREKVKRLNLCDAVEALPNLSGILIRAINMCKSSKGLSFTELKEVLGAKGYDVSRYCPSIRKQLKSLTSKGALVRMTHRAGSSFFVIRKHQGKEAATQASAGSEKIVRVQKMGTDKTNSQRTPEKVKETGAQAKSPGLKAAKVSRTFQRLNKKWKSGAKRPRQPPGQRSLAKTFKRPVKETVSAVKRANTSAANTVPKAKRPNYSRSKPASSRKTLRSTAANAAAKSGSPVDQTGSKRSRVSSTGVIVSKKGLGGPHSYTVPNVKASKYSKSNH